MSVRRGKQCPTLSPSRQTSRASASPMRACRSCLVADAAHLRPDADGLAPCDIVIDNGRIATIGPAVQDGLARFDLDNGIVLPRLVDVHTHIDKGHIWHRAPNPDGSFMGARTTVMADREANWSAEDVARRMDFSLRCAFAHGTGALRTHIDSIGKQTAHLVAGVRRNARGLEGPHHAAGGCRSIRSNSRSTTSRSSAPWSRPSRAMAACSAGSPIMGEPLGAEDRRGARQGVRGREGARPRSRFPCGRERLAATRARSGASPTPRCATSSPGKIVAGHCCSLALCGRRRARRDHRQGGGGRHRGRVAADVQHVSAGPQGRPHAALARCRAAARARRGRRHRDGRERQHARSVLRLWRPRPARGVSRGDAHPALRPFGRSLAADRSPRRRAR